MQALESSIYEDWVARNHLEILSFPVFVHYNVDYHGAPVAHCAHVSGVNRFSLA